LAGKCVMADGKRKVLANRILWALGLLLVVSQVTKAEQLPIKTYTTADGLAHNVVNRVVRDSRGFLWFCTREGLSRFDGYSFTNCGVEQGLPSAIVNDLLETREGVYWVATAGGLCRFNPLGKPEASTNNAGERNAPDPMFTVYFPGEDQRSRQVLSLFQDRAGVIWCGTGNGLYRREAAASEVKFISIDLGMPDHFESRFIDCLLEDRGGALWVGSRGGLYRRWPDARIEAYTNRDGLPDTYIRSLLEDREGHIWVGTAFGSLCRLVPDPAPGRSVVARAYSDKDGLPTRWINQLFQASDGSLWAGSNAGLIQFIPTPDGNDFRFRAYSRAHGFSYQEIASLAEDRNGNLWVAIGGGGAAKIVRSGFTTFGKADGFFWASTILETRAGELLVVGAPSVNGWSLNRFDGEKFNAIRPRLLETIVSWGWNQTVLEDHAGEWWVACATGAYRFPKVSKLEQLAHTPPKAIYTTRDGLAADMILRLFEDSHGDVWIGSAGHVTRSNGLSRWERSTNVFHHYSEKDNLPRFDRFYVSSFAEDRAGNLWIGFSGDSGLGRYRNGGFTLFTSSDGVPAGQIRNLLVDRAGRLWVATSRGGLSRIDDPAAEYPKLFTYTTANGLSSNEVTGMGEDQWGRIYIGTGRGIDRLDPATDRIKHYTTADGLSLCQMEGALRDHRGALWFSSFITGLVRFVPEPDSAPVPPPILITGLRIAGDSQPISALGEVEIAPIELGPYKNQLQIDFVALGFSPGEGLLYQYTLEGADQDWSPLTEHRTVNFANLAPGRYRFVVRAVNAEGVLSEAPASFSFKILSPIWQRWWFIAIVAGLTGLLAFSLYRYRVARLLELERVRTRIAADLHDDIGSNLSQIAIWSDVAQRDAVHEGGVPRAHADGAPEPLERIAATARETASAMSDIVWAINPRRDYLSDLISRMRRFAGEAFDALDLVWQLDAPQTELSLHAESRREVFLIFKECVNNIIRHAQCTRVEASLTIEGNGLRLCIRDDGCGFNPHSQSEGHGLDSMRARARSLGGALEIESAPGRGTMVEFTMPLNQSRWPR
jgi:ligand-binding sensor domain-containing protein/signal transduction histidine kinase